MDNASKTELYAAKAASKVAHKTDEGTGKLMANKIAEILLNKIFIPTEKRQEILNELRQVL